MHHARIDYGFNTWDEMFQVFAGAFDEIAEKATRDLLRQHTLVSPDQASELEAWFNLQLESEEK